MAEHPEVFAPLLTALKDLVAWLQDAAVSGTIIGGVAASLLGRPRVTRDIDALVLLLETPELLRDFNALVARRRKRKKPS